MTAHVSAQEGGGSISTDLGLTALLARCLAAERKAQQELYQRYAKAMYNTALRITGNEAEAQDVLQDAFVNAFRSLAGFKGQSTFGAWLKKIVVHGAILHLKRKRLQLTLLDEERYDVADTEAAPEPGSYEAEALRKAIQLLPDGYRSVLSLYLLEGYDHQEIAQILDISEGTSKSQFNRAKARLKIILIEMGVSR